MVLGEGGMENYYGLPSTIHVFANCSAIHTLSPGYRLQI